MFKVITIALVVITWVIVIWTAPNATVFPSADALGTRSVVSSREQALAVRDLLTRLIPKRASDFIIRIDSALAPPGRSTFEFQSIADKIQVTGSTGYAAASGVHHYLKYFCGCHISWSGNQLLLPHKLPAVETPITVVFNDRFRYYQNVCTPSYSFVWWNWTRWEKEIDWMALNGINLPLAFTGQEWIWKMVFKSFNFTDYDVDEFFTGPAFLAWNRMGNIQFWGGPLSDAWHYQQRILQHRILNRMRSFHMTPVLPAFSGRVPPSIVSLYPNASVTPLSKDWGHFRPPYGSVLFLEPTDPLFKRMGEDFLRKYAEEYGTNHIYSADLFNEMEPPSNNTRYLADCAKSAYETMAAVDPKAIWLLQGWMFYHDPITWQPPQVEAFVTSVPQGRLIILDLQAELFPQYKKFKSYYGQPFIWCMLHNYGGVSGLYGSLAQINMGPFAARNFVNSTMIGTGITPEGIETNDVVYELMNEMAWRKQPVDLDKWVIRFATRRYGNITYELCNAWLLLERSVYNADKPFRNHGKYILTTRPSLHMSKYVWYEAEDVFDAWRLFINASMEESLQKSKLFRHDLVDVTRQGLQLIMVAYYNVLRNSFHVEDMAGLKNMSSFIVMLYDDLEQLLASDLHFLLGPWLRTAKSWAVTPWVLHKLFPDATDLELKQYEYNARNQITLWGPNGEIVDYANKQWSGIALRYYKKRWELFVNTLVECLERRQVFNETVFKEKVMRTVEIPFTLGNEYHPAVPKGDPIKISQAIFKKYWPILKVLGNHI